MCQGWADIASAPKDGTIILLWDRGWPIAARWIERYGDWVSVPHNALISHAFGEAAFWMPMIPGPPVVCPASLDNASPTSNPRVKI